MVGVQAIRVRGTGASRRLHFGEHAPLTRAERIVLLVLVGIATVVGVVFLIVPAQDDLVGTIFQIVLTLMFAVFAWSTRAAVALLVAATAASFVFGSSHEAVLALAIACGCVVRTGTGIMTAAFIGAFLLSNVALSSSEASGSRTTSLTAVLLVAIISGAIGVVLRSGYGRERRLAERLTMQELAKAEIIRGERLRIADELHDVIAHDLTIIAMHARVLDHEPDDALRSTSQRAIGDAARKALADIRRVVDQADTDDGPGLALADSLPAALADARLHLEAVRHPVVIVGDAEDESITRLVGSALARIVRESVTNIVKHSGTPGPVRISLGVERGSVHLLIRNECSNARKLGLPSGGYGTVRMTERARTLGGTFEAGPDGDGWLVAVSLPVS